MQQRYPWSVQLNDLPNVLAVASRRATTSACDRVAAIL
jgi:hypothetical protein